MKTRSHGKVWCLVAEVPEKARVRMEPRNDLERVEGSGVQWEISRGQDQLQTSKQGRRESTGPCSP